MPTTLIRNAPWLVALDKECGQHQYRRGVAILFDEGAIRTIGKVEEG